MSQWFWKNLSYAVTWISTVVFFGFLVFLANIEIKDLDLWLHFAAGRYILGHGFIPQFDFLSCTIAGQPWANHEWLFQVIVYAIFNNFGSDGLHLLQGLIVGLTFVLLFSLGYKRQLHLTQLIILILVLLVFQLRMILRPEMFSLFFFVFYVFILTFHAGNRLSLWILFLIQVAWVNIHGFFILGPLLILIVLLGEIIKAYIKLPWALNQVSRLNDEEFKFLIKAFGVALAASLINPAFIDGAFYPLKVIFSLGKSQVFFQQIVELQRPLNWNNLSSMNVLPDFKLLIVISFMSFVLNFRKLDITIFILWAITLASALGAVRNIVYFAFVAYLCTMSNLNAGFWKEYVNFRLKDWTKFLLVLAVNAGIILWISGTMQNYSLSGYYDFLKYERKSEFGGISLRSYPVQAVDFLEQQKISGNFYNDFNSGAYLLGRLHPQVKVFIDGRTEVYGEEFFKTYNEIQSGDKELFDRAVEQYSLTAAFINATKVPVPPKLFKALYEDPQWKLVYFDYDGAVFLKNISYNKQWIKDNIIDLSKWKAEKADLIKIGAMTITPYQHLHRAFALYYLDFKDKALDEVEEALKISPDYDQAYYLKARILYDYERYSEALEYFRKAKVLNPASSEIRYGLARAFYKLGDNETAFEQLEKLLSVDPKNMNGLYLLAVIYAKEQKYEQSYNIAMAAKSLSGVQTEGLMEVADELTAQKQWVFAKRLYEEVLNMEPGHEEALKAMKRFPQK